MNKPIITVRDMNLWYGQTQALKLLLPSASA